MGIGELYAQQRLRSQPSFGEWVKFRQELEERQRDLEERQYQIDVQRFEMLDGMANNFWIRRDMTSEEEQTLWEERDKLGQKLLGLAQLPKPDVVGIKFTEYVKAAQEGMMKLPIADPAIAQAHARAWAEHGRVTFGKHWDERITRLYNEQKQGAEPPKEGEEPAAQSGGTDELFVQALMEYAPPDTPARERISTFLDNEAQGKYKGDLPAILLRSLSADAVAIGIIGEDERQDFERQLAEEHRERMAAQREQVKSSLLNAIIDLPSLTEEDAEAIANLTQIPVEDLIRAANIASAAERRLALSASVAEKRLALSERRERRLSFGGGTGASTKATKGPWDVETARIQAQVRYLIQQVYGTKENEWGELVPMIEDDAERERMRRELEGLLDILAERGIPTGQVAPEAPALPSAGGGKPRPAAEIVREKDIAGRIAQLERAMVAGEDQVKAWIGVYGPKAFVETADAIRRERRAPFGEYRQWTRKMLLSAGVSKQKVRELIYPEAADKTKGMLPEERALAQERGYLEGPGPAAPSAQATAGRPLVSPVVSLQEAMLAGEEAVQKWIHAHGPTAFVRTAEAIRKDRHGDAEQYKKWMREALLRAGVSNQKTNELLGPPKGK